MNHQFGDKQTVYSDSNHINKISGSVNRLLTFV